MLVAKLWKNDWSPSSVPRRSPRSRILFLPDPQRTRWGSPDEFKEQDNEGEYTTLRRVVFCFFDSSEVNMRGDKRLLFSNPDQLDKFVLENFHSYFHPLKGLAKEWFQVLLLAHQFHAHEYHNIHDRRLSILDRALDGMSADIIDDVGQAVLDKRKVNIKELYGNPFGKVQTSPVPHVSPSSQRQMSVPYSQFSDTCPRKQEHFRDERIRSRLTNRYSGPTIMRFLMDLCKRRRFLQVRVPVYPPAESPTSPISESSRACLT